MSQAAAIRRRRQWANRFRHLGKIGRPIYFKTSLEKQVKKRLRAVEKAQQMQRRKKKS